MVHEGNNSGQPTSCNANFTKSNSEKKTAFNLQPHQHELLQLADLAGIHADPSVMRTIIELLNMKIDPTAIVKVLRQIRRTSKTRSPSRSKNTPT